MEGNCHLTSSSKARGAANLIETPPLDFDTDPRPTPGTAAPDIGADEVQ